MLSDLPNMIFLYNPNITSHLSSCPAFRKTHRAWTQRGVVHWYTVSVPAKNIELSTSSFTFTSPQNKNWLQHQKFQLYFVKAILLVGQELPLQSFTCKGIRSRELTYPTLGKGKSSGKVPLVGDMLLPGRVDLKVDVFFPISNRVVQKFDLSETRAFHHINCPTLCGVHPRS